MQLVFVMGTAGELIKLFPLLYTATLKNIPWCTLHTGQSGHNFWRQWDDFRLPREKALSILPTTEDLEKSAGALKWFLRAVTVGQVRLRAALHDLLGEPFLKGSHIVVHGDTLSTLLGAIYAKRLGGVCVHVEAGLRSTSLFEPFPEEINRRIVSRLTRFHMCPDQRAVDNLTRARVKGQIVNTLGNTLYDTIHIIAAEPPERVSNRPYCVVNVHRFENLNNSERWEKVIRTLEKAAKDYDVKMVLHPPTRFKLKADPASEKRLRDKGVQITERLPFRQFIQLMHGSEFVISDGGSNQEECFYMGLPSLLLREKTERQEGLGSTALLSGFVESSIDGFLSNPKAYRRDPVKMKLSPTEQIWKSLQL